MAWTELPTLRTQRSRSYQDDLDPTKRHWSGTLAALHYQSTLDSANYDTPVDLTAVRIDNPSFDGWQVTQADYHYALGKDLAHHGSEDGWVGFAGRQGAHWLKFQLLRTGYLHWPTRTWDDIGGAPTYDRTNLSHSTQSLSIGPNDDPINVQSSATWANIWTTPGAGAVDVRWSIDGDRLKEDVILNQAGREWIASNRPPATPLTETWFGFVFRIDWSDVPRIYRAGILQDVTNDFADDGEPIHLCDVLDRALALLPLSDVRVPQPYGDDDRQPIRKRFWSDSGNHYLLIGVRCDTLNAMAAGDLVFDPTVNEEVGASDDDAYEQGDTTFNTADDQLKIYTDANAAAAEYRCGGCRFQTVAVPNGATIDSAYLSLYNNQNDLYNDIDVDVFFNDVDDAVDFAADADIINRTRTTAAIPWDALNVTINQYQQSPDIKTVVKEIVDRGGWATGQDMVALIIASINASGNDYRCESWDDVGNANNPKLDITYSTPGGVSIPVMMHHYTHQIG